MNTVDLKTAKELLQAEISEQIVLRLAAFEEATGLDTLHVKVEVEREGPVEGTKTSLSSVDVKVLLDL